MNSTFQISTHIMGDVSATPLQVEFLSETEEYEIIFPEEKEKVRVKFSDEGNIVQTYGTPLDSNTIHHLSEEIKKHQNIIL